VYTGLGCIVVTAEKGRVTAIDPGIDDTDDDTLTAIRRRHSCRKGSRAQPEFLPRVRHI
jgi:hypothetical protein